MRLPPPKILILIAALVASACDSGSVGSGTHDESTGARGVTATTVTIGITYVGSGTEANAAGGVGKITTGDPRFSAKTVADDINKHGGIAGRKVALEFYRFDAKSTAPYSTQDQAACAHFTQDSSVVAVLGAGRSDMLGTCLNQAHVVLLDAATLGLDRDALSKLQDYLTVASLSQDRLMKAEVHSLGRSGYFDGWNPSTGTAAAGAAKTGILSLGTPTWERPLKAVLLPALAQAGHTVADADIFRVHYPGSDAENGQAAADVQAAVLRFRADHVTHVIILDANGGLTLLFGGSAAAQRYYPRLGITSASGAQALFDAGALTKGSLNGASGLGWWPTLDLPADKGATYLTAAAGSCLSLMSAAGLHFDSTNATFGALSTCDQFRLLKTALDAPGATLDEAGVRSALEDVGDKFTPASTPGLLFSKSRHDGVQRGYDMVWSASCSCMTYSGGAQDLG